MNPREPFHTFLGDVSCVAMRETSPSIPQSTAPNSAGSTAFTVAGDTTTCDRSQACRHFGLFGCWTGSWSRVSKAREEAHLALRQIIVIYG